MKNELVYLGKRLRGQRWFRGMFNYFRGHYPREWARMKGYLLRGDQQVTAKTLMLEKRAQSFTMGQDILAAKRFFERYGREQ